MNDRPYISVVINLDTRPENHQFGGSNLMGVVDREFLTDGVLNKIKMFKGFDCEFIVFADEHEPMGALPMAYLYSISNTVCVHRHSHEKNFNDNNYLAALQLARGEIVFHFDGDCMGFASSKESIQELIDLLETYDYVSYPTTHSPNPEDNPSYDYWWVSTRFFLYKRETLNITEIEKCLNNEIYLYNKYPATVHNQWLEHIMGLISKHTTGRRVYYPPMNYDKLLIFCWDNYRKGMIEELNKMDYADVKNWVLDRGGIFYPNQVRI